MQSLPLSFSPLIRAEQAASNDHGAKKRAIGNDITLCTFLCTVRPAARKKPSQARRFVLELEVSWLLTPNVGEYNGRKRRPSLNFVDNFAAIRSIGPSRPGAVVSCRRCSYPARHRLGVTDLLEYSIRCAANRSSGWCGVKAMLYLSSSC
jgi:hypothetical protein